MKSWENKIGQLKNKLKNFKNLYHIYIRFRYYST